MKHDDFLVEILTEELPPKSLLTLAIAFCEQIRERLKKAQLHFDDIHYYATPRRLCVIVHGLSSQQKDQATERRGPSFAAAYQPDGSPTPALLGFLRSANADISDVFTIKTPQGEWVGLNQIILGKSIQELLPSLIEASLLALPVGKSMRWGEGDFEFVRPVQAVMMLYGEEIVDGAVLGSAADRCTRGHRFLAPDWLTIPHAKSYVNMLEKDGFVIVDFKTRQEKIVAATEEIIEKQLNNEAKALIHQALLDEVTGLVEWPVALCGQFDREFLQLPKEVLISAMEDHQRYFPITNASGELLPYFITISNIQSRSPEHVVQGNERVLRARLKDAAFFYDEDRKITLADRVEALKGMVYQAKLGTLYDKAKRLSELAAFIAGKLTLDTSEASRAGWLAKADLTTNMVGEFPELQGVMGAYYAKHDEESSDVQVAIKEHYWPRFANDAVPETPMGQALAIADRMDALVGAFGIQQIPTGDKDPYGLRRAALGVLRILIQGNINLDLHELITYASSLYTVNITVDVSALLSFMNERLRAWYQEQGFAGDIFAAVSAIMITNPLDAHKRMQAVHLFKSLPEAEALSIANKRVSHILMKYPDKIANTQIDSTYFEHQAEGELALQLAAKHKLVEELSKQGNYEAVLIQLAELREPIDNFFDHVMVMTDDKARRENRILLLTELRSLFLKVADIALLQ